MKRNLLIVLLLILFINIGYCQIQKKYLIFDTHSKSEAVYRSLVAPGWGQFYNKQNLKGYAFLGSQTVLVISYFYLNAKYNEQYNDYSVETDPTKTSKLYDDAESTKNSRNYVGYAIIGVWVLGMVDAYISGWDYSETLDLSISYQQNQPTLSIKLFL